jgi:transcriptional regulator with XRE-family HTH domain
VLILKSRGGINLYLGLRRERLLVLLKEKGWGKTEFARKLEIHYSYFYRLLKGERNPGSKFFNNFSRFCQEQGLKFEDYVYIKIKSQ